MFGIDENDTDSSDSDVDSDARERKRPTFRDRMQWERILTAEEFKARFRMYPRQLEQLLAIIGPKLIPKRMTNHALRADQKLLVALRFFATDAPFLTVADAEHISKATTFRCVKQVVNAVMDLKNIKWPETEQMRRKIGIDFFNLSKGPNGDLPGFPCCCGALDGSLIPIEVPAFNDFQWVDRHGGHSINAQGIAGPNLMFYSASVKWPGSVNDSRVLRNSSVFAKFESGWRPFENAVIIGDSIYPMKNWLIANRNCPQLETFFRAQKRARRVIECAWGLLKNRFQCLRKGLNMKKPEDSANVIMCCIHLHNFLIENKIDDNEDMDLMPAEEEIEDIFREDEENLEAEDNPFLNNEHVKKIHQIFMTANNLGQ